MITICIYIIFTPQPSYSIERNLNPKASNGDGHVISNIYDGMEKAIKESVWSGKEVNVDYFYRMLCTSENMILVHTKCHPNEPHEGKHVDQDQMFKCPTNSNSLAQDKKMDATDSPGPSRLNGVRAPIYDQNHELYEPLRKRKRLASENGHNDKKD